MAKVTLKIDQDEIYEHLIVHNTEIEYRDVIEVNEMLKLMPQVRKLFAGTSADEMFEQMIKACKKVDSLWTQKLKIKESLLRQEVAKAEKLGFKV